MVKSLIFEFLRLPGINLLLKCCRPVLALLDMRSVDKYPVRGPVLIRFRGRPVFVMESDGKDSVASGAFWVGLDAYEGCTLPVFAHLAAASRHVVDVGANTGVFSLLAASINPRCTVHAFEPFPAAADLLEANVHANRLDAVRLIRSAVGNRTGTQTLHYNEALRLTQGASLLARPDRIHQITIPIVSLDEYLQAGDIEPLDLVKIDVEGTEPEVLQGAAQTISRDTPDIVIELIRKEHYPKLRDFLRHHDYRAYRLAADGLHPDFELAEEGPVAWNRLFIHSSRLHRLDSLDVPIHSA